MAILTLVVRDVLFPLHEYLKDHPTSRILRDMESADRMSGSELAELSNARLRYLIRYSYENVPFVRDVMTKTRLEPSRIESASDLVLLPVMRKSDIRANRPRLRSTLAKNLVQYTTTGSTGDPLLFDISKRRIASRVACRQRVTRWYGLSVGDPEIVLWGSPVELTKQDWVRSIRDRFLRSRLLSAFEMKESTMDRYLDFMERYRCRMIFGYPSSVYLLCRHARNRKRNLRSLGVKAAFVTGIPLYAYEREMISEVLNCPVADGYGGRDSGFIAHECPQGGMHILSDAVIVETVDRDGQPVPTGESGEIVVTDLYSEEAPFIRYATGDYGVLSSERCRCGRALPMIARIDGRVMDFFLAADGRLMPGGVVFYALYGLDGIEQFKVIQKKVDQFHIQIVADHIFNKDKESLVRQRLEQRMRSPLHVSFEYLKEIPAEKTGKFRGTVSELPEIRDLNRQ
jgi:phenylacetate-CoA ligase